MNSNSIPNYSNQGASSPLFQFSKDCPKESCLNRLSETVKNFFSDLKGQNLLKGLFSRIESDGSDKRPKVWAITYLNEEDTAQVTLEKAQKELLESSSHLIQGMIHFNQQLDRPNAPLKLSSIKKSQLKLICNVLRQKQTIHSKNVAEIIALAAFLQIPVLLEECQKHLTIDDDNVLELLSLSASLTLPLLFEKGQAHLLEIINSFTVSKKNFKNIRYFFKFTKQLNLDEEIFPDCKILKSCESFFNNYLKFCKEKRNEEKLNIFFAKLRKLEISSLAIPAATAEDLKQIQTIQSLTQLILNDELACSDKGFRPIQGLALTSLEIDGKLCLTDEKIAMIVQQPLTELILRDCPYITDQSLDAISALALTKLTLSNCPQLTDRGLESLEQMPLTDLDLNDYSQLTDKGLRSLYQLPLKKLNLSHCYQITYLGVEALAKKNPSCDIIGAPERPAREREDFCTLQ